MRFRDFSQIVATDKWRPASESRVVDTSCLVAIAFGESGAKALQAGLVTPARLPNHLFDGKISTVWYRAGTRREFIGEASQQSRFLIDRIVEQG